MCRLLCACVWFQEKVHSNTAPVARCLSNYLSAIVVQIQHSNPPAPTAAAAGTGAAAASASAASAAAASTSSAAPLCETIEWRKHSSVSLSDGFEVRRRGTGDVQVLLSLYQDFSPPRFRIAPRLAQVLGFPLQAPNPAAVHGSGIHAQPFPLLETAGAILTSFWEYVKKHELQDPRQPGLVRCDQALAGVLGVQEMQASSVLAHLQAHLSPAACEPVVIPYHIRASTAAPATTASGLAAAAAAAAAPGLPSPSPSHVQCFDLLTYAPVLPSLTEAYKDASQYSGVKSAPPPSVAAAAARHTEKLSELLLEMDKCNRRREMLQAFSEAPTHVMHCVTAKQAKDQLVSGTLAQRAALGRQFRRVTFVCLFALCVAHSPQLRSACPCLCAGDVWRVWRGRRVGASRRVLPRRLALRRRRPIPAGGNGEQQLHHADGGEYVWRRGGRVEEESTRSCSERSAVALQTMF